MGCAGLFRSARITDVGAQGPNGGKRTTNKAAGKNNRTENRNKMDVGFLARLETLERKLGGQRGTRAAREITP